MSHSIVVDSKTWYVFPQIGLAGVISAGEGLHSPHQPELYSDSYNAGLRCEELGIEIDFDIEEPEPAPEPAPDPEPEPE